MGDLPSLCSRLVAIGISAPYASQLSRGVRTPDDALALRIYDAIGVQLGLLKGATPVEIAAFRRMVKRTATQ